MNSGSFTNQTQPSTGTSLPTDWIDLASALIVDLDRELGYFGFARWVLFYYVPRAESVVWDDGRSYGFGAGAWRPFIEHIEPLAGQHHVNLANGIQSQVLLIDRQDRKAYFAPRAEGHAQVDRQSPDERVVPQLRKRGAQLN